MRPGAVAGSVLAFPLDLDGLQYAPRTGSERFSGELEGSRRNDTQPTPLDGGDHSFGSRFGSLRNRPPVFGAAFRVPGVETEKRAKKRWKMSKNGEICWRIPRRRF